MTADVSPQTECVMVDGVVKRFRCSPPSWRHWGQTLVCGHAASVWSLDLCVPLVSPDGHPPRQPLFILCNVWKHYESPAQSPLWKRKEAKTRCPHCNIINVKPCLLQQVLSISITSVLTRLISRKFAFRRTCLHSRDAALLYPAPL